MRRPDIKRPDISSKCSRGWSEVCRVAGHREHELGAAHVLQGPLEPDRDDGRAGDHVRRGLGIRSRRYACGEVEHTSVQVSTRERRRVVAKPVACEKRRDGTAVVDTHVAR